MKKIIVDNEFFNIKETLNCGQIFRFKEYYDGINHGFLVYSTDKCCFCYETNDKSVIECEDNDEKYFYNFFDLYSPYDIYFKSAIKENVEILTKSANLCKGVRILRQESEETLFSFIVSQNNHIPRIKGIIERLAENLGVKKSFLGTEYFSFPSAKTLAQKDKDFFMKLGLGYRADYFVKVSNSLISGFSLIEKDKLETKELKKELLKLHGVGPKVADCVSLFGFHRLDSFPVDTWIEKVYKEDFNGTIKDRDKISQYLVERFKGNSGIYQQYLFNYKRNLENK